MASKEDVLELMKNSCKEDYNIGVVFGIPITEFQTSLYEANILINWLCKEMSNYQKTMWNKIGQNTW